ncbi:cobalamin B12-binding domain-containing protein [Sphingomonas qomolangmaensis]|uniref:Cobalamin B12-binding domain-containing protein n=1 Tax=Sphingomonas qomolangmaensis TaxID=2918765 RepID=A0ABY5L737_9SPHN|nr:cobalamin B12-binding domain-containing protein [Sphingomonas qomolangmaensis]UUL81423.1 cobalamin B12-binding domain-containing protein [Sphingomonas qomolangmaensis]
MGQTARALAIPTIDRQSLHRLETLFIVPDIYRRDDVAERQAKLARIVSNEIVPRLLKLHAQVVPAAPPITVVIEALVPTSADITGLADIVLGSDLEAAAAYVLMMRERGLSMETLFVELLEPAARLLGEMWDRDDCDFIDVTLGVARLQKLLAVFNETHVLPGLDTHRTVLMAMTPGDQHFFGIAMVERFLTAAGWQVRTELEGTSESIADVAKQNWFAVVGLTAGSERQLESMRTTIAQIRRESRNQAIGVMVGGPMFTANPELARDVGADGTAPNAPAAVLVAQKLFDLGHRQRV